MKYQVACQRGGIFLREQKLYSVVIAGEPQRAQQLANSILLILQGGLSAVDLSQCDVKRLLMVLKRQLFALYGCLQLIHRAFNRLNLSADRLRFSLSFGQIIRHAQQGIIDLLDLVN